MHSRRSLGYRSLGRMLGLMTAIGLIVAACGGGDGGLVVGDSATDFPLEEASGGSVALDDYRGQDVLLYFHIADG